PSEPERPPSQRLQAGGRPPTGVLLQPPVLGHTGLRAPQGRDGGAAQEAPRLPVQRGRSRAVTIHNLFPLVALALNLTLIALVLYRDFQSRINRTFAYFLAGLAVWNLACSCSGCPRRRPRGRSSGSGPCSWGSSR